tara:strand:+ start:1379 stop:4345 length:2967 start_codon:yes stop_codon:yes gene_type:complete
MSTIKINELAAGTITLSSLLAFADSNGIAFQGSVDELSTFIGTLQGPGIGAAISATDVAPTEDGLYPCQDTGTYTNFGGLAVDVADTITFISVSETQTVFQKVEIPITLTIDSTVTNGSNNTVSGNAVFDALNDLNILTGVNQNKISSNLGNIATFLPNKGFLYSVIKDISSTFVNNKNVLRLNYVGSAGTSDAILFDGSYQTLVNSKANTYGWFKKSDLATLPNNLTFMSITNVSGTVDDIVKLDYISPASFVLGFTETKTVGDTTVVLNVLAETEEWVFWDFQVNTTNVSADGYSFRFYLDGIVTATDGNLDVFNFTSYSGTEYINYSLDSLSKINGLGIYNEVINLENSETITVFGDSYSESYYTLKGKAYLMKVAEQLPYRIVNFAKSGDDTVEEIIRLEANEVRFNTTIGVKDINSKYGLIALYANDSAYRFWDLEMFKENVRDLIGRIRDLGMQPILSMEFFLYNFSQPNEGVLDSAMMKELAREMQVPFIDVTETAVNFYKNGKSGTYNGTHPATRTNSVMHVPIARGLQSILPQPKKSLKIYRNRVADSNFAVDTVFKNDVDKIKIYQELNLGHVAIATAYEHLYDDVNNVGGYQTINDEYLSLINKESVNFERQALLEFIVPYSSQEIQKFKLKYKSDAVTYPFIRKRRTPFASTKGTCFKYTGAPSINVGDVYTISSSEGALNGDSITITGDRDGFINALGYNYAFRNKLTTGTLTRTSGSGSTSISFTEVQACFEDDYYTQYSRRFEFEPKGQSSANDEKEIEIDNSDKNYVEGDVIYFLIRQTSGFNLLEQPTLEIIKSDNLKVEIPLLNAPKKYATGSELLTQNLMGTTAQLADWTVTGNQTETQPLSVTNPIGTSGSYKVNDTNYLTQSIAYDLIDTSIPVQIKIWASNDTPLYNGTNMSGSDITTLSYDNVELKIELYSVEDQPIIFRKEVSLGLSEILIDTFLPQNLVNPKIRISTKDGNEVAIFKCSVKKF